jgi:hypothetical protein
VDLAAGKAIAFHRDVDPVRMEHVVVHTAGHRARMASYYPWSPDRFDDAVEYVRNTSDTRLVAVCLRYGDSYLHVLCVQNGSLDKLSVVMIQMQ